MSERTPRADPERARVARLTAAVLGALIVLAVTMLSPATARAHTGFESSTPSVGTTVDEPVELVTIVFTGEANPVGEQFVAFTPADVVQQPVSIETVDDKVFSIRFDPPLTGGEVGIRWNVQAADAHPIEGAFSFTVNATAPTTAAATTTAAPAATVPAETAPAVVVDEASPPDAANADVASESSTPVDQTLDEFLTVDNSTPGETTLTVGHLIGFLGVTLGLGTLAFVATAMRGRRDEIQHALSAVRIFGLVLAVGAVIEYVGVTRIGGQSLISSWKTAPAFAAGLRIVGGIGLAVGIGGAISYGRVQGLMRRPSVVKSLSAAVVDDVASRTRDDEAVVRWTPNGGSWPSLAGAALVIVSFWFDGHTVSKGFRPLHALVNSVHVAAGAVWVGGVVTMAAIIWSRYRHHEPMRVVELVVRFSKIATIALASVVAAGGIMAFLVLDSFGELTGTQWGKILLLKTAAVGLAMIGGAYNHFRLLPALEADPESPELLAELRSTVTAEAIMLLFVVTVTAWLVSASS